MQKIRQSMLNDFERCMFLGFYRWGSFGDPDRQDEEFISKYAAVGVCIHDVMNLWAKKQKTNHILTLDKAQEELTERLNEIPTELFEDEEERESMFESAHEQLEWLFLNYGGVKPLYSELNFEFEDLISELPPITGTIDRIDGNLEIPEYDILDYKTGKVYTYKECKSNMQATLYALACERLFGIRPKRFIFIFSKHKKTRKINITDEFLEAGIQRIKNIWFHIVNGDFRPPKKPNKYFCQHFCEARSECPKYKGRPEGWEQID